VGADVGAGRKQASLRAVVGGCLTLLVLLHGTSVVAGEEKRADPEQRSEASPRGATEGEQDLEGRRDVAEQARRDGRVRAILELDVDFSPEGAMRASEARDQRASIARQQRSVKRELRGTGARATGEYRTVPYLAMELTEQSVERLRTSTRVTRVMLDEVSEPALADSGPLIQADDMHAAGFTGQGRMVAILDTGVESSHEFFGGRVVEEACYSADSTQSSSLCPGGATESTSPGSGEPCVGLPGCEHGTHVAGIAAGSGPSSSGVAPGSHLMAVQVFSEHSCGGEPCALSWTSDQIKALERVYELRDDHDIASVNMSLSSERHTVACDADPRKAIIDQLRSVDIATVVSAGNNGWSDAVGAPACVSSAISVGSTTKQDAVSGFSNSHPTLVDLYAPGDLIESAVTSGEFGFMSGTSMAAPQVAGAWAALRHAAPQATVNEVLGDLRSTGVPITDDRVADANQHHSHPRVRVDDARVGGASLIVTKDGSGLGSVTSDPAGIDCGATCIYSFDTGTQVTLSATPSPGHEFVGWSGGGCSGAGPCTLDIDGTITVTASFAFDSNSSFADATVIDALPFAHVQATSGAELESGEPLPTCDSSTGATVWFRHTASETTTLIADTFGSDFDTVLQVYRGQELHDLEPLGCDWGADHPYHDSHVEFVAEAGETYYMQLGGAHGQTGQLSFNLDGESEVPAGDQWGFVPVTPCAVFDSRFGSDGWDGPVVGGEARVATVVGSVPASQGGGSCEAPPESAVGVVLNLVAASPVASGNLRLAAAGSVPAGGVLNFVSGVSNSNAVPVEVDEAGQVVVEANAPGGPATDVRGVVLGYYVPSQDGG
jgi:hypothetical protein